FTRCKFSLCPTCKAFCRVDLHSVKHGKQLVAASLDDAHWYCLRGVFTFLGVKDTAPGFRGNKLKQEALALARLIVLERRADVVCSASRLLASLVSWRRKTVVVDLIERRKEAYRKRRIRL